MGSKLHVCSSGEGGADGKDLPVCVALPIIVGVWSMVVVLWQLLQYFGCDILKLTVFSNVDLKEISNSM